MRAYLSGRFDTVSWGTETILQYRVFWFSRFWSSSSNLRYLSQMLLE